MGQWLDSLTGWLSANPQWLGLAIFLIACVECLAIAGIIVPGTVLLFAVAMLAGSGGFSLGETLLLGLVGGLLGDALSYGLGKYFHQNIRRLPLLRHHPEWIGSAEAYFHRYGIASLLVGRFIGPLRPMLPMVAGMFDMPLPRFIAVSLVAGAGWSVAYLLPGWATGAAMRLPLPEGFWLDAGIIAGTLAVVIGLSLGSSLRDQRHGTRLIAGLSLIALVALFLGWPHLHEFDQGVMTLVQEHRSQAIDSAVVLVTRLGDFRTQLFLGALLTGLLLLARQWRHALLAGSALMGTAIANGTLKWLFARARPEVLSDPLTSYSMPSGHSSASFAFFLVMALLAGRGQPPRMRLTWVLLGSLPALAIALSRVYLGAHWPTDILAGGLLACCVCALSLTLVQHRQPLGALPPRVWWLVLPACIALMAFFALYALPQALLRYQY
ncbi:bifunctional DedA family/phosphatase PAP2 family protein [Pseudomonas guariconensis]|uniref:bifunctional DedA family/phosphatase PAP2 family protein n=1 Tax=Pseudomonas TaxID=286 RepID=UPI002096CAFB|nr:MULTISPECIES: bifunctional DedA family/phosphatase PAP2 family protein [Pseudomonas]MCO7641362.1 bifunctional DedA family/phosphatase PAP2 family protein [Pseudomonas sp. S 311-6]MCO7513322.1 bifunctional DedA family/phosphatase PAP2 family protein [Pseudomonas putida]MCO7566576.1 bifunctional DedA family/phosphatase PAP2 family protein [Pseudomonas mosselii]MCO7605726.1 bifunctional DedA family/phosphatase PAP2 family protein [Pseudomonas guariconensis]MCO7618569.1 bifunctional DedA family